MRDLFDMFPDLPRLSRRPVEERVQEVRDRAGEMRRKVESNAAARRVQAARVAAAWRRKVGK